MSSDSIKVLIKVGEGAATHIMQQPEEMWENEGGAIISTDSYSTSGTLSLPFLPGEHLKVVEGHVEILDGQHFYNATLKRIDGQKKSAG